MRLIKNIILKAILCLHICLISGNIYAQINISEKDKSIREIIHQIEKASDYNFFFNNAMSGLDKKTSVHLSNSSINEVLNSLLKDTDITYTIKEDNQIVLTNLNIPGNSNSRAHLQKSVHQIKGIVTDERGEPIIGANVVEKGTTNGVITDIEGQFSLLVMENATLDISYVGYVTQSISVKNQTNLSITLIEDSQALNEVVVVGYGTQKKVNLTGSVVSVSSEELSRRQVAQTSMALQGVAPGVTVTQRSGQPGSDGGNISIRGLTTLKDNSALVLVDGVEMGLNNIDPTMIESISILKDAASSAIYGSRAANGVILVTTKRASENKLSLSYNTYVGWQKATNLPKMVGAIDHMTLINEAYVNAGSSPLYTEEYIEEYRKGINTNSDRYPDTDWFDSVLTGSGFMQNHTVSMSGGTEKARVFATLGYLDQNGIVENTNYRRYSLKVNSDFKFTSYLSAQIDASIIQTKSKAPSKGASSAIHDAGRIPANQPAVFSNGQWGEGWNGSNPVAFTRDGGLLTNEAPSVVLNMLLRFQPLEWMMMELAYSPNYWQSSISNYSKSIQTYTWDGKPSFASPQKSSLTATNTRHLLNNLRYILNLEKSFGVHYLKVLGGFQQEDYRRDNLEGYREVFTFADYPYLDAGGEENQKAYGNAEEWALRSFFGRINYAYKDRYLFEANYRYDGSSRFAKGNRWGGFPSFSAGWRISEEEFFSSLKETVSNLKLRASWGQLGNQNIGTYPSSSTVNLGVNYAFDGKSADGAAITDMANTEISWETTTVTNVGVDVNLWGKFNVTAEYYYKRTRDILLRLDVPKILGLKAPYQNAGTVENKGWDIGINYNNRDNAFKYEIGFNLSDVRNKVLDLKGISETDITANREGYSMNSLYGLVAERYIRESDFDADGKYLHSTQFGNYTVGDIKYAELSGDNVINEKDYRVLGGTIPRFTYGLTFNAEYRNFDFGMLLQGVGKANGMIHSQGIMPFYTGGTVQEQHKDRWTPENPDAKFPRLAFNETNNTRTSSFWMKNAAYLRLKNIQLGYTLPKDIARKIYLQDVRFYVSAQNLLTFDDFWDGYDVEAPVGNGGYYPQQKTYSIGLNVQF